MPDLSLRVLFCLSAGSAQLANGRGGPDAPGCRAGFGHGLPMLCAIWTGSPCGRRYACSHRRWGASWRPNLADAVPRGWGVTSSAAPGNGRPVSAGPPGESRSGPARASCGEKGQCAGSRADWRRPRPRESRVPGRRPPAAKNPEAAARLHKRGNRAELFGFVAVAEYGHTLRSPCLPWGTSKI